MKKLGSAVGASTRRKICQREASRLRIILIASGSAERRPSSALTVIGKKQIRATTTILGPIPKPNQTSRIGAMTTIGIVCEATISG